MYVCVSGGNNTVFVFVHVCIGVGAHVIYHWTNAVLWGVLVEAGVRVGGFAVGVCGGGVVGQNGAAPQMK